MNNNNIGQDILNILIKYKDSEYQYINPHFLQKISELIFNYYSIENDEVDEWISDMWSA